MDNQSISHAILVEDERLSPGGITIHTFISIINPYAGGG